MKILIFTEGTILMHFTAKGLSREEIVKQSKNNAEGLHDFSNYIPVGNAVKKIKKWKLQKADIYYLTSRTSKEEVTGIRNVLDHFNFPEGALLFRQKDQTYAGIAEKLLPDILIEDDCESIGGKKEMTYTFIDPKIKGKIVSIPVKEFGGIDHLPGKLERLKNYEK